MVVNLQLMFYMSLSPKPKVPVSGCLSLKPEPELCFFPEFQEPRYAMAITTMTKLKNNWFLTDVTLQVFYAIIISLFLQLSCLMSVIISYYLCIPFRCPCSLALLYQTFWLVILGKVQVSLITCMHNTRTSPEWKAAIFNVEMKYTSYSTSKKSCLPQVGRNKTE